LIVISVYSLVMRASKRPTATRSASERLAEINVERHAAVKVRYVESSIGSLIMLSATTIPRLATRGEVARQGGIGRSAGSDMLVVMRCDERDTRRSVNE
jgi:hypothetical protein